MSTFRNADGDVLDVPDSLAPFVANLGYAPVEVPESSVASALTSPAATTPDPTVGDNDSKGVTNNG